MKINVEYVCCFVFMFCRRDPGWKLNMYLGRDLLFQMSHLYVLGYWI